MKLQGIQSYLILHCNAKKGGERDHSGRGDRPGYG